MGAKYDIVGGIVSDAAMKQLQEIEKLATSIGQSLQGVKLSDLSKGGKDAANLEKINAQTQLLLEKQKLVQLQEEKLQQTIAKGNAVKQAKVKLTQEEAVTQAALNNVSKLRAILASQETSALQKLDAQMRLNVLETQKYVAAGDTQNANYLKLIANTAKLSAEYDRMAKASGSNMVKTQSMYGATFQLTQVMRELPNFAIDARIGFMALSNNLPMLIDSFKNLSQQIDVNTGKMYGFGGAAKQFAKSLLSLNTIMIVVSTALILFGDKIVEIFTGKIPLAERAMNSYIKAIKEGNSEFSTATKTFFELSAIMTSASKGFISQKDAVEEYNKAFGKTNGYVTTFEEAQKRMVVQTPNYIKAMGMMAYANTFLAEAVKLYGDAEALRADKTVTAWQKVVAWFKRDYLGYKSIEEAVLANRENEAKAIDQQINSAITSYQNAYSKFAEFAQKSGIDIWGDEKKPKSGGSGKANSEKQMQDGKDFNIAQKQFNEERIKLLNQISEAEEGYQQKNETGERNSFGKRLSMAETFRNAKLSLFNLEYKDAIDNLKFQNDLKQKQMRDDMDSNEELFLAGKMTKERFLELSANYNKATYTLGENFQAEMKQLEYDYIKDVEKNEISFIKNRTNIIADSLSYIEQQENEKLNTRLDMQQAYYDISMALVDAYYQKYNEKLEKESKRQSEIEDEKYKDIEDKEKAGVLTKQEAEEEKARTQAYYDSVQEELDRQKAEKEKESFLISQAFAIADIWIKYAQTMASYTAAEAAMTAATLGLGAPAAIAMYEPLKAQALFQAGASTALILAQSIPAFEQGGVVAKDGTILAGEKRHELAILPDGSFFVTANKPTLYDVPKGTEIMPDLNKIDIMELLHLKPLYANHSEDKQLIREMQNVTRAIKTQKQGNFYGMPLIKQLDNRGRFDNRRKSLMN